MTTYQNAARIWPILAQSARDQQTLNSERVRRLIGVPRPGLDHHLAPIQSFCAENDLPPLSILVVWEGDGLPLVGVSPGLDITKMQGQVFAYDRDRIVPPTPKELKDAAHRSPIE